MRYIFNVPFALLIKQHDLLYDKKPGSINIIRDSKFEIRACR